MTPTSISSGWTLLQDNYGFQNTAAVGDIPAVTAAQRKEDCEDFLYMLSSYLPHGFLTDKILKKSTSFNNAFNIIEEHYGLLPSQETFCDFTGLSRAPNEPYRQFYDRLVAFLTQHLMPHKVAGDNTVDGCAVPVGGDQLNVTHLNMVALMWLQRIHPDLLSIVRTEYSKELRDNTALAALVPRISLSIDALLTKYDKVPAVNKMSLKDEVHGQEEDRKSTRLNSSHSQQSRMPSSA